MPPKKSKKRAGGKPVNVPEDPREPVIKVNGPGCGWTFSEKLQEQLKDQQEELAKYAVSMEEYRKQMKLYHKLKQEEEETKETYDACVANDHARRKKDRAQATKDAEKAWKKAENELEKFAKENKEQINSVEKRKAKDAWVTAQAKLEDFLFYQNHAHRWMRHGPIDPKLQAKAPEAKHSGRMPYMLTTYGAEDQYYRWLRQILDEFDQREIGTQGYRKGHIDAAGNRVEGEKEGDGEDSDKEDDKKKGKKKGTTKRGKEIEPVATKKDGKKREDARPPELRKIPHRELHLWTPPWRRVPVGLRRNPVEEDPWLLKLDYEQIEEARLKVETAELDDADGFPYRSHNERREAEIRLYAEDNPEERQPPTASFERFRMTQPERDDAERSEAEERDRSESETPIEPKWKGKIRTDQGLFIAAQESSWDWRTSYDLAGRLVNGNIAIIPRKPSPNPDDFVYPKHDRSITGEGAGDGSGATEEAGDLSRPAAAPPVKGRRKRINEEKGKANDKGKKKQKGKEKVADESEEEEEQEKEEKEENEEDSDGYDYAYEKFEFTKPPRSPQEYTCERSTQWFEATDGRRERHVYNFLDDSSPVNSPPHPPIRRLADEVPDDEEQERLELEMRIDGTELYRARQLDHYGLKKRNWPGIGIRIPYEIATFDRHGGPLSEIWEKIASEKGLEAEVRYVHSLQKPIMRKIGVHQAGEKRKLDEALRNEESGGEKDGDGSVKRPRPSGPEGGGDDSDGDLFKKTYKQGSGVPSS
ncbi:hypothetical protein BU26DRAFT_581035 [Trematosphaeria pertusa]|uniref:Uncharacterized protein n=1 Tax=Trematosphaeria pertusa TaxID=390896 RepID=A0A6A6I145_9PLEO|nr:uncharacterized protein BU26DRAFT_581035 [Trematosphaeria pertusa]KAF2243869.1 hypothetical protein BU26DRAFT_581035 [Trematosphaeria pertusa]